MKNPNSITNQVPTARQYRALKQLLVAPTYRKPLQDIVGASNLPECIRRIRKSYGMVVKCDQSNPVIDRDGLKSYSGLYSLNGADLDKALTLTANFEKAESENKEGEK